jgi:hypothetical protein
MKGKSRVVKMNYGGGRDYDKIRRQEAKSIQKETRHFQKVSSGFSFMGMFLLFGKFFQDVGNLFGGFFGGLMNGFYREEIDTSKGISAADSRRGGQVRSIQDPRNKNRRSIYYKMNIPKSLRKGLSFEEAQLLKKALYPRFRKNWGKVYNADMSLQEMMDIRIKVVGF